VSLSSTPELRSALRPLVALRNDAYRRALLVQTQYRNLLLITAGAGRRPPSPPGRLSNRRWLASA
jgi:hypothetical protein